MLDLFEQLNANGIAELRQEKKLKNAAFLGCQSHVISINAKCEVAAGEGREFWPAMPAELACFSFFRNVG